jgi:hypothetical protein
LDPEVIYPLDMDEHDWRDPPWAAFEKGGRCVHPCTDSVTTGRLAGHMTTPRTRRKPADSLSQDLAVGLHTVTEINQSIRYADTKAAGLATVQALAVTVIAAKRDGAGSVLTVVVGILCLGGVLISFLLLAAGQVPRMSEGRRCGGSRIAFPVLAELPLDELLRRPSSAQQHEQVWRQAAELASIAVSKFRLLRRAMISTVMTLVAVLLWLGLTAWIR